jgi:hypothetical protein
MGQTLFQNRSCFILAFAAKYWKFYGTEIIDYFCEKTGAGPWKVLDTQLIGAKGGKLPLFHTSTWRQR